MTYALAVAFAPTRASAALSPASRIGPGGVGPVVFGTTPAQAASGGLRFTTTAPAAGSSCYYLRPGAPAGLTFLVESGTIRRAEMRSAGLATTDGFRVGDAIQRVTAFYGQHAQLAPDKYDPMLQTVTVVPQRAADRKFRLIFKAGGGTIRAIYAGALPQVAYVEGCS